MTLQGIIRHFLRIVPYHKKTVRHRMRLSVIFDDWSIIFTFMFNMGKNLSVMKGKMSIILKKMSITGQKMSIIAPGVHHRPRYVQNPVPIGHCPATIPFSNCRQNALQLRRSIRPQIFPQIMNGPRRKNGGFPVGLPAKRNMCRSGLAPSQGRLFLNPPAGKEAGRDGTWMEPPIILEPGGGNRVRIFPANFSRPVPLKTPDHRK